MPEFEMLNARGHRACFSSLGAAVTSIAVPDARGTIAEVTVDAGVHAGKTIGRYANRIAGGSFELDGVRYDLPVNEGRNTLHSGPDGFWKREWSGSRTGDRSVTFELHSADGDQGFPGAMACRVTFTWSDDDALQIEYEATTTRATVINLTNHAYFNLNGGLLRDVSDQELQANASAYTPFDDELIPTGEIRSVAGTDRDFQTMRPFGSEKYDTNLVIDGWDDTTLLAAAHVRDPRSGRTLTVMTTQPGLQLFTGKPGAFALETQHFADSPHHQNFPSTVLRPGSVFRSRTVYRFGVEKT